jgi:hypothetical protein
MQNQWNVTYELITPESAEHGEAAERGFELENASLRDAIGAATGSSYHAEADCYPVNSNCVPTWFTFYQHEAGTAHEFETGELTNRSLHIPESVTVASRLRIAKLLRCYGA